MKNTGIPWRYVALSGACILAGVVLDGISGRRGTKHTDSMLDEALDGTFPASDAVATQDFSAPEDRTAPKASSLKPRPQGAARHA